MSDRAPLPTLPHRPEARPFSVEELVRRVLSGQIRVPSFQRDLKWTIKDVLDLLDSIYRGYPVGTLLLWQRPAEAETLRYGTVEVDAPARSDALMVVDGQQRIRALTQALAGAAHPEDPFACHFDARQDTFLRVSKRDRPAEHQIPLTEVLDSERLIHWILERQQPLAEDTRRAAVQLGKRIREYQIPAYLVITDDEDAVRQIFRRANDTGRRMEEHEVFDAIHRRRPGHAPATLRDVAASLASHGFGGPDEGLLLQMLQAIRGVDAFKERVPELGDDAPRHLARLERSAAASVSFLRTDAGIPHASLLPYQQPLLALARFFDRFPEPSGRSRELLTRWLWRGSLTGAHRGDLVATRTMSMAIRDDEADAVDRLLALLPPRSTDDPDVDAPFRWQTASSKLLALALLDLDPRDLTHGSAVRPAADDTDDARWQRLFRDILDRPHAGLANHLAHPPHRRGLIYAITTCDEPAWLASHAISVEARRALKFDRVDDFLALRAAALRQHVSDFLERRARWDETDAPAVETLLQGVVGP